MNGRAYVALAVTLVAASGCSSGKKAAAAPPAQPPLAVDAASVTQRTIATSVSLDGQITPLRESTLSSPESGTLVSVDVEEGAHVSQGQLLAKLDTSQLEAQLAANRAAVEQAESRVSGSSAQAPISSQQYGSAVTTASMSLDAARNRVQTAREALRNAELVFKSDEQLAAQGYVAQTALAGARAAYVSAQQEVNNAMQSLPAAQAAVTTARSNTGQTQVDQATIGANRAALAQAQANVKLIGTQIAQSSIYAPFEGVVTQRLLDPGAFAGPNQGVVRVSQLSTVYVNANVPDEDLGFVRAGTPASFTSASLPGRTFEGTIYDVNATPTTGTLAYRARIRQPNPGDELRGGMLVTVLVQRERHPNALVVPRTAVFQSDAGYDVYTISGGKAKLVPITLGIETDSLAEVRAPGLVPGTTVILTRPDALHDGSAVATAAPAASGAPGSPTKR